MGRRQVARFDLALVAVAQNGTNYTADFDFGRCTGTCVVKIVSSAGSITVTQQVTFDGGKNWADVVDASANALGAVAATMTVGTRYVSYSPLLTGKSRFKIVEGNTAASNVTISVAFQEEAS